MTLSPGQKAELLAIVRDVLPNAEWAPEQAFDEAGNGSVTDEAVHFQATCRCEYITEPAALTLFVKTHGDGAGLTNAVARIEHAVERWATGSLRWDGCGDCKHRLVVDVRLFVTRG